MHYRNFAASKLPLNVQGQRAGASSEACQTLLGEL